MKPSDWIKAATLVTQYKQEATMEETDQLSSMPLSQIEINDNVPPIVHYGMHMPVAVSTPTGTDVHVHSSQHEDSYQQIIPGIPQGSLYPTLSSLSSGAVASNDEVQSLQYPTGIASMSKAAEQINESSEYSLSSAKQESMEEVESAANILESLKTDTSHTSQHPSQPCTDTDKKHQHCPSTKYAEQNAVVHQDDDEYPPKNTAREPTSIHSDQLLTVLLPTDDVITLTENILVTNHLQ